MLNATRVKFLVLLAFILCSSAVVLAKPTENFQVQKVVQGWLRSSDNAFGTTLGRHIADITVYIDANKEPLYYIVHLQPSGFVIVAADDEVEPIVGFSGSGSFDPSPQNPLGILVSRDLPKRIANAKKVKTSSASSENNKKVSRETTKWATLQLLADSSAVKSSSVVSDIRVSPLIQSQWNQGTVCDNNCYNYYTPNNYKCGCVATAMAQLMRFHRYPASAVGTSSFTIYVNGVNQTAWLRGGDGFGGPYVWDQMPLIPDCNITKIQCQAIGALCYDAGIAINTNYGQDVSTASVRDAKNALITTFQYTSGIYGFNGGQNIGENLIEMINPNLDAGYPVILSIGGDQHSVVADGYGYDLETLYHHINMGHSGIDNAWYNLPDFHYPYNDIVDGCVYNLYVTGSGEIISGRITTSYGTPINNVVITATTNGNAYTAITNSNGIYALAKVPSNKTFAISAFKTGLRFSDKIVNTGKSSDASLTSGNVWAVDFINDSPYSPIPGDFGLDGKVDFEDFATLASAWRTQSGQINWNPACDISSPADNIINFLDLAVFAENWLITQPIPGDFGLDGKVDFEDFATFAAAWMTQSGQMNWNPACDISSPTDNVINFLDFTVFTQNWLQE